MKNEIIKKYLITALRFLGLVIEAVGCLLFVFSLVGWLNGIINAGIIISFGIIYIGNTLRRPSNEKQIHGKKYFSKEFKIAILSIVIFIIGFVGLTRAGYMPNFLQISALEPLNFNYDCPSGMICGPQK